MLERERDGGARERRGRERVERKGDIERERGESSERKRGEGERALLCFDL